MAKNRYNVTDEKIELIFQLLPVCKTQRAIAGAVGLSKGTVQKILAARMIEQNKIVEEERSKIFNIDSYSKTLLTI